MFQPESVLQQFSRPKLPGDITPPYFLEKNGINSICCIDLGQIPIAGSAAGRRRDRQAANFCEWRLSGRGEKIVCANG
jgi:hypothetical protein